jgi:hypothetical protein
VRVDSGEQTANIFFLRNVRYHGQRFSAGQHNLLSGGFYLCSAAPGQHDFRPLASIGQYGGAPDTGAPAGNQSDFALQTFMGVSLYSIGVVSHGINTQ